VREIPNAMGDDQLAGLAGDRQSIHRRKCQVAATGHLLASSTLRGRDQHRQRAVDAEHVPSEPGERKRVSSSAAADVEGTTAHRLGAGEGDQRVVRCPGGEAANR